MRQRQKKILFIVVFLAFVVHFLALYSVHGLIIEPLLTSTLKPESRGNRFYEKFVDKQKDLVKKKRQLAVTFNRLTQDLFSFDRPHYDMKDTKASDNKYEEQLFASGLNIDLEGGASFEYAFEGDSELNKIVPNGDQLAYDVPLDLLFIIDEFNKKEMVRATLKSLGDIDLLSLDTLATTPGKMVGDFEDASPDGNFDENQLGYVDEGKLESNASPLRKRVQQQFSQNGISRNFIMDPTPAGNGEVFVRAGRRAGTEQAKLGEFDAVAGAHDFSVDVAYTKTGSSYLFRILLRPKKDVLFKGIKQNVTFLIDRSHSISTDRYEASKEAVSQALDHLKEGDTFNVFVFDKNVTGFSRHHVSWNQQNIAEARQFLTKQKSGGMFASTDLFTTLSRIIPDAVSNDEVNIAVLLTDGDTFLKRKEMRSVITHWTYLNEGKISLYSIAVGRNNNLSLLHFLSALNKGRMIYVRNAKELIHVVTDFMQAIQNPIGKDVIVTPVAQNPESDVVFLHHQPHFFSRTPYVLYGRVNKLEDFYLFVQGQYYDKWLDIREVISFKNATLMEDETLEKMWALQQAYGLYENYLIDQNPRHLSQASRLLSAYKIPLIL